MWINGLLVLILAICVITDVKNRMIYNIIIFPGLLVAFVSHLIIGGWSDLAHSLVGFLVGFSLLLIPYLLGGMGAGDVKLLALVGALKGTAFVLATSVYMALVGALLALGFLLCRKGAVDKLKTIIYFLHGLRYGMKMPLAFDRDALSATYPYGVAIAAGAVLCLFYRGLL
jgi:prepilin peptidase CpaA